jgi:hypothetical protein
MGGQKGLREAAIAAAHNFYGIKPATSWIPGILNPPFLKGDLGGLLSTYLIPATSFS